MRLARTPGKSRDQRSVRSRTPLPGVCFLGPFLFSCPFFLFLLPRPVLLDPFAHITFYVAVPAERRSCMFGVNLFRVGHLLDISSACYPYSSSTRGGAIVVVGTFFSGFPGHEAGCPARQHERSVSTRYKCTNLCVLCVKEIFRPKKKSLKPRIIVVHFEHGTFFVLNDVF